MKRTIIFLTALLFLIACQKQTIPSKSRAFAVVNVGTTANDGTGTPLRTAWQYQNANWVAQADTNHQVRDSLLNKYTKAKTRTLIGDTISARLTNATDIGDYVDSIINNVTGTGGSVGMYQLKGIVGTTSGFPANGDSLIINSSFITHTHVQAFREGALQWQNTTNAGQPDGFKFTQATGTLTFKPVLTTGEQVIVQAFDPIVWHELTPEGGTGGGGGSGASPLLTGLVGYYKLDETSGSILTDATGIQNAQTTSAVLNSAGYSGRSVYGDGTTAVIQIPYNVSQQITGATVSIACKINIGTLPSVLGHEGYLIRATVSGSPYEVIKLAVGTDNKVHFTVRNSSGTTFTVESSGALSPLTWYRIVAICPAASATLKLFVNESDVSTTAGTFTGDMYDNNSLWYMLNAYYNAGSGLAGYIDDVGIWNVDVTSNIANTIKTYPFN